MNHIKYYPFERNHYYKGKLLNVNVFESEQRYMNDKRRINHRFLSGFGVICGLDAVAVSEESISVETGYAIDGAGREIVVAVPEVKKLSSLSGYIHGKMSGSYYLYIQYAETPSDIVYTGMVQSQDKVYEKIKEGYMLYLSDSAPVGNTGNVMYYYKHRSCVISNENKAIELKTTSQDADGGEIREMEIPIVGDASPVTLSSLTTSAKNAKLYIKITKDSFDVGMAMESFKVEGNHFSLEGMMEKSYWNEGLKLPQAKGCIQSINGGTNFCSGLEKLELNASDLLIRRDDIEFKELQFAVEQEIKLNNSLNITNFGAKVGKGIFSKIDDVELSGGLSYNNNMMAVGGTIILGYHFGNKVLEIRDIKDLSLTISPYGKAAIGEFQRTDKGFDIKNLCFSKAKYNADKENAGLIDKLLSEMPTIGVRLSKLSYVDGDFQMPAKEDFSIDRFEKEISFLDGAFKGKFIYDDGAVDAQLTAQYALPKERGAAGGNGATKVLYNPTLPIPIVPPFLSAEAGFQVFAGAKVTGDLSFSIQNNKLQRDFSAKADAKADGVIGAGVTAGISLISGAAKIQLEGNAEAEGTGSVLGTTAFTYKKGMSLKDGITLNREQTSLEYNISGNLALNLKLSAGAKIPSIFIIESKELKHSWSILTYNLGSVDMKGTLAWDEDSKSFDFQTNNEVKLNVNNLLNIESQKIILNELDNDYTKLKNTISEIDDAVNKINDGGEIIGINHVLTAVRTRQISDIYLRLLDAIKTGSSKLQECFKYLSKMRQELEKRGIERLIENEELAYSEKVIGDAEKTFDIIGRKEDDEDESKYYIRTMEKLRKLQTDEEELSKLAALDPVAMLNTFKVFQLNESKSLFSNPDKNRLSYARERSMKMYSNTNFVSSKLDVDGGKSMSEAQRKKYENDITSSINEKSMNDALDTIKKMSLKGVEKPVKIMHNIASLEKKLSDLKNEGNSNNKKIKSIENKIANEKNNYQNAMSECDPDEKHTLLIYMQNLDYTLKLDSEKKEHFVSTVTQEYEIQETGDEEETKLRLAFVKEIIAKLLSDYDSRKNNSLSKESQDKIKMSMQHDKFANYLMETELKKLSKPKDEKKLAEENDYFNSIGKLYDDYSNKMSGFNMISANATKSVMAVLSNDYNKVKSIEDYKQKSSQINKMLETVGAFYKEKKSLDNENFLQEQQVRAGET